MDRRYKKEQFLGHPDQRDYGGVDNYYPFQLTQLGMNRVPTITPQGQSLSGGVIRCLKSLFRVG